MGGMFDKFYIGCLCGRVAKIPTVAPVTKVSCDENNVYMKKISVFHVCFDR